MILAIDPGLTGAIALLDPEGGHCPEVWDIPTIKARGKRQLVYLQFNSILAPLPPGRAILEKAQVHPKQGSVSSFRTGEIYGACKMALVARGIRLEEVSPARWRPKMLPPKADKEAARLKAIELFPELEPQLCLKKHHDRAEALLLAEYARRYC